MKDQPRPQPLTSADAAPYWEAATEGRLALPYCLTCQKFFFYPRPFCPHDFSWNIEWRDVSGRGVVHAFTIIHRAFQPGFETPYVTALIDLDEGVRMMANLVEVDPVPEAIRIGMPVDVTFPESGDGRRVPQFRPRASG